MTPCIVVKINAKASSVLKGLQLRGAAPALDEVGFESHVIVQMDVGLI